MNLPSDLKKRKLLWVDGVLFYERTIEDWLADMRSFFQFCKDFSCKLYHKKCTLFTTSFKCCGRMISEQGILHDPSDVEVLTSMDQPTTRIHFKLFLCPIEWLRSSIPYFQPLVQELQDLLEVFYAMVWKRTKRAASRLELTDTGWAPEHTAPLEAFKQSIFNRTTIANLDEQKRLFFFIDASDSRLSGMLTQVPWYELCLPHGEKSHKPLAFNSSRFSKTQLGWSTL